MPPSSASLLSVLLPLPSELCVHACPFPSAAQISVQFTLASRLMNPMSPCVLNTLRIQQLSDVILFYDLAFFATALICRLQKGTPALCVEPVNSAMTQHAPCIHSGV